MPDFLEIYIQCLGSIYPARPIYISNTLDIHLQ